MTPLCFAPKWEWCTCLSLIEPPNSWSEIVKKSYYEASSSAIYGSMYIFRFGTLTVGLCTICQSDPGTYCCHALCQCVGDSSMDVHRSVREGLEKYVYEYYSETLRHWNTLGTGTPRQLGIGALGLKITQHLDTGPWTTLTLGHKTLGHLNAWTLGSWDIS